MNRSRSKLVKRYGMWCFEYMHDQEWLIKKQKIVEIKEGIHTHDDLIEYLEKEMTIRDPIDTVQYKFILIPNYKPNEGLIIFKAHHCLGDGLAVSAFLLQLSGHQDTSALPGLKPGISWY